VGAYADDFILYQLVMMGVLVPSYNTIRKRREMLNNQNGVALSMNNINFFGF
jgi:hypothetical protein